MQACHGMVPMLRAGLLTTPFDSVGHRLVADCQGMMDNHVLSGVGQIRTSFVNGYTVQLCGASARYC